MRPEGTAACVFTVLPTLMATQIRVKVYRQLQIDRQMQTETPNGCLFSKPWETSPHFFFIHYELQLFAACIRLTGFFFLQILCLHTSQNDVLCCWWQVIIANVIFKIPLLQRFLSYWCFYPILTSSNQKSNK